MYPVLGPCHRGRWDVRGLSSQSCCIPEARPCRRSAGNGSLPTQPWGRVTAFVQSAPVSLFARGLSSSSQKGQLGRPSRGRNPLKAKQLAFVLWQVHLLCARN